MFNALTLTVVSQFLQLLTKNCFCSDLTSGWNYINLHCRDNDNKPVDWWYVFKPAGDGSPFFRTGRNFSFITPDTAGHWRSSPTLITANSMLQYTLSPLFRPTYTDYLATVAYDKGYSQGQFNSSAVQGIMMADELGGLWIGHTIPNFPDMSRDRPNFPDIENDYDHMIMCLTVDLFTLNKIAVAVGQTSPWITKLKVPKKVKAFLPEWTRFSSFHQKLTKTGPKYLQSILWNSDASTVYYKPMFTVLRSVDVHGLQHPLIIRKKLKAVTFTTRNNTMEVLVIARSPGDNTCLFKRFARDMGLKLNVYDQKMHKKSLCQHDRRDSNAKSLKHKQFNKLRSPMFFAMRAISQPLRKRSPSYRYYWTCFGHGDIQEHYGKGDLIVCVEHPQLWAAFVCYGGVSSGLRCKDVDNSPVDWWYIYKPPSNSGPGLMSGLQFAYITSQQTGRWQQSPTIITAKDSMLDYTLAPLFLEDNKNHIAHMVYQDHEPLDHTDGSTALGVLMGDELGAIWVTHTVPHLIDLNEIAFRFPVKETDNGHLLMCLSIDLPAMNGIGKALGRLYQDIVSLHLPARVKEYLPYWSQVNVLEDVNVMTTQKLSFKSRYGTLQVDVLLKPPGSKLCLYSSFAKYHNVILDTYGHAHKNVCDKTFSVRNIESISLKVIEDGEILPTVWYINNNTDKMGFAISTAAHWQRQGKATQQYWTCFGNGEHQNFLYKSGLIVCVRDYDVWWGFDNFKVKEPVCW